MAGKQIGLFDAPAKSKQKKTPKSKPKRTASDRVKVSGYSRRYPGFGGKK